MIEKNGIVIFTADSGDGYFSQRNNELVWPSAEAKPNAQYRTSWKNMCNGTSYVDALRKSGFILPSGKYKQPEDNLCYHILTSPTVLAAYKQKQPAMYNSFIKSLEGKCTERELEDMYFPNELHDYLCMGANEWIGTTAAKFSTNVNFKKALWRYMVNDNLPMVISTNFGGFGHIVCVTGVQYKKEDWMQGVAFEKEHANEATKEVPEITPVAILIDDPWGNASKTKFESYPAGGGGSGNDIIVPWDIVVKKVKPYNSTTVKWAHTFNHPVATI